MTNTTVMKEDTVGHLRPTMRKTTVPAVEVTSVHARDLILHVSSYLNSLNSQLLVTVSIKGLIFSQLIIRTLLMTTDENGTVFLCALIFFLNL
jgi:hypothetical protein